MKAWNKKGGSSDSAASILIFFQLPITSLTIFWKCHDKLVESSFHQLKPVVANMYNCHFPIIKKKSKCYVWVYLKTVLPVTRCCSVHEPPPWELEKGYFHESLLGFYILPLLMLELYSIAHINPQVLRLSVILSIPQIKGISFPSVWHHSVLLIHQTVVSGSRLLAASKYTRIRIM